MLNLYLKILQNPELQDTKNWGTHWDIGMVVPYFSKCFLNIVINRN